jgi:putative transcriptional regulator
MTKLGQRLITAADEALDFARGSFDPKRYRLHIPEDVDVREIRNRLELSQTSFAAKFAIPEPTLRDWEQGRRKPNRMARLLLLMLRDEPAAVRRVLNALAAGASLQRVGFGYQLRAAPKKAARRKAATGHLHARTKPAEKAPKSRSR